VQLVLNPVISSALPTNRDNVHPRWYIRAIIYLVAFLHTKHRVSFAACALILACLGCILSDAAGNLIGDVALPVTLTTVFLKLAITDNFKAHPICFVCHEIFDIDSPPDTFCPNCDQEIFGGPTDHFKASSDSDLDSDAGESVNVRTSSTKRPTVVAPIQLLSTGLRDFFQRPGMIGAVNSWKTQARRVSGVMRSMQDADVWKTIKDPNQESFFFGRHTEKEIRLGVSFSLDWSVSRVLIITRILILFRFGRKRSSFGPSHSSGVMSFCIQNLTTALR
jgi:hypothetical protein